MLDAVTSPAARSNVTASFMSPQEEPFVIDQQTYAQALLRDPCAIARDNINTIRMSQVRRSEFLDVVEAGNRKGKWTNENGEVIKLALVVPFRDSPTRWGSGYLSFRRFGYLRQVCPILTRTSTLFSCKSQPLTYYINKRPEFFRDKLSEAEWTVLNDICDILEVRAFDIIYSPLELTSALVTIHFTRANEQAAHSDACGLSACLRKCDFCPRNSSIKTPFCILATHVGYWYQGYAL